MKHLPRFILYRSVSQRSLVVRLPIDLAVLLRDDRRSHGNLSTAFGRTSSLSGRGCSSGCWIRHWSRCDGGRVGSGGGAEELDAVERPSRPPTIHGPDIHASSPNFANRPVLPDGLSKTHKSPILASGSIHCGIRRICGRTDRTSSTQQPAERLDVVVVQTLFPCLWLASELDQNVAGTPLFLLPYPSLWTLPMGTRPTSDAVASPTRECSSPLML